MSRVDPSRAVPVDMATEWIPTTPTPCSKAALAGMVFFGALERLASSSIMAAPATLVPSPCQCGTRARGWADVAKRGANHTGTVPHITALAVLAHSPKDFFVEIEEKEKDHYRNVSLMVMSPLFFPCPYKSSRFPYPSKSSHIYMFT
uniref:Uncharacterized protein n=1 Tax=Oryza glaberrima TaxID=4538 RepID=I1Q2I8_ORYGL